MAIISQSEIEERTGTTYTGANAVALAQLCTDVDAAIKARLKPYYPEPATITCYPDAYPSELLLLDYRPVRSITSVYYRPGANRVSALFTSDYLLDNTDGDEYTLDLDPITSRNDAGILRRVDRVWGYRWVSPPERLGYALVPEKGALKVVAAVGPATVPPDIALAATRAVLLLYQFRVTGIPQGSESWNGYSINYSQPFTAEAAINTPEVMALLAPYTSKGGMSLHIG